MALDGIVISNIVAELNSTILNSKISKIAEPEADELLLTLKGSNGSFRLSMSASASLPFIYLTPANKVSPLTAPTFCMVLRKHIANGRITKIYQPGMERIINFEIEHLNEMGDLCHKVLIIELMGKYSNIIFTDSDGTIIDSAKRIPASVSSVREVLPGRAYTIPATQEDKYNPLTVDSKQFVDIISAKPLSVSKAIYSSFSGISPLVANELAHRAGLDADAPVAAYSHDELLHLGNSFTWMMDDIKSNRFTPNIVRDGNEPKEFASIELTQYGDLSVTKYDSISEVLELYYSERNTYTRIRQKSADLRKHVNTLLERNQKKYSLQMKQLKDSEKREKYKVYGELINAFGYGLTPDDKFLEAANYYDDNKIIKIPIDNTKTPAENAQKYFDKYGKMKRTAEALNELIIETKGQIDHLESIQNSLDIALNADDLVQIKDELIEYGFIKKGKSAKKQKVKSKPFHYVSSDGFDMYVGKNNYQNDELTFKLATGNDWWFHAKGMPGSHVIVKAENKELPDRTFEEAGKLAGYYSKGKNADKVEIDYLQKKNVKKPNGAAAGFVVYYTNYSLTIHPDISDIRQIE
ncbi:Rqc2 family fibronectin-binding protein [Agathobacter sp.]|uniref:Rqc2 family fibronectin-binding protein n=1 Tax=Agathobacter sp. TaxID=2021311 RepID=UPI003FD77C49